MDFITLYVAMVAVVLIVVGGGTLFLDYLARRWENKQAPMDCRMPTRVVGLNSR